MITANVPVGLESSIFSAAAMHIPKSRKGSVFKYVLNGYYNNISYLLKSCRKTV